MFCGSFSSKIKRYHLSYYSTNTFSRRLAVILAARERAATCRIVLVTLSPLAIILA